MTQEIYILNSNGVKQRVARGPLQHLNIDGNYVSRALCGLLNPFYKGVLLLFLDRPDQFLTVGEDSWWYAPCGPDLIKQILSRNCHVDPPEPLADNEVEIAGERYEIYVQDFGEPKLWKRHSPRGFTHEELKKKAAGPDSVYWARCLNYFESTPQWKAWVARSALKDNEVVSPTGRVHQLRWHNGERQHRCFSGGRWHLWEYGRQTFWERKADAWFDANRPLAEDETMHCGKRCKMGMTRDGRLRLLAPDGRCFYYDESVLRKYADKPERLAYIERNRPLPSNQVRSGEEIYELRWHDGRKECLHVNSKHPALWGPMHREDISAECFKKAEMWFRLNEVQEPATYDSVEIFLGVPAAPVGLSWSEAHAALMRGEKVRRKSWASNKYLYKGYQTDTIYYRTVSGAHVKCPFFLLTNDWEIA